MKAFDDALGQLSPQERKSYELATNRFESAWQQAEPSGVDLAPYLPDQTGGLRSMTLVGLAKIDMEQRWKRGDRCRVEAYRERFPEELNDDDFLIELSSWEFQFSRLHGDTVDDLCHRFPTLAERMRQVLPPAVGPRPMPELPLHLAEPEFLEKGGMGIVLRARDASRNNRIVAVKLMTIVHSDDREAFDRFITEIDVLNKLSDQERHGIVAVLEHKEHAGRPYYVMEYCRGGSLQVRLRQNPLMPAREAAALVRRLADIMHAVHGKNILHRDLKPGNILLEQTPDEPLLPDTAKVADFGLAKVIEPGKSQLQTQTQGPVGTPYYMAPEQIGGLKVTAATDVYALGVILYECLTGRRPFLGSTQNETFDAIRQLEPTSPRSLSPSLDRDLETICLKCLEKEQRKRYASASELADDLGSYMGGRPIAARRVGLLERTVKWTKRRPAVAALIVTGSLTCLAFAAFLIGLVINFGLQAANENLQEARNQEEVQRKEAERQQDRAEKQKKLEAIARADADKSRDEAKKAMEMEAIAKREANHYRYLNAASLAYRRWQAGDLSASLASLADCPNEYRRWEWYFVHRLCHQYLNSIPAADGQAVFCVAYSPNGKYLATGSADRSVKLWDGDSGKLLAILNGHHTHSVWCLAWHKGSNQLSSGDLDGTITIWDVPSRKVSQTWKAPVSVHGIQYSPNGEFLLSFGSAESKDNSVIVWNGSNGLKIRDLAAKGKTVAARFIADGKRVLGVGEDGLFQEWDALTGVEERSVKSNLSDISSIASHPDGNQFALGTKGGSIFFLNYEKREGILADQKSAFERERKQTIRQLAFSPDGAFLASCSEDGTVAVWDFERHEALGLFKGHYDRVSCLAFRPDGKRLASGSYDATVKIWDPSLVGERAIFGDYLGQVQCLACNPDDRHLAGNSLGSDRIEIWDWKKRSKVQGWDTGDNVIALAYSPDGRFLVSGQFGGDLKLWNPGDGRPIKTLSKPAGAGSVRQVSFNRASTLLAACYGTGLVIVWNPFTGDIIRSIPAHTQLPQFVAFSPDGESLLSAGWDGMIKIWSATTGKIECEFKNEGSVFAAACAPVGRSVVFWGLKSEKIQVADIGKGTVIRSLPIRATIVTSLCFSPDGDRLACSTNDGRVVLWDTKTGSEILTLRVPSNINQIHFSSDGMNLVAALGSGKIAVWEAASH